MSAAPLYTSTADEPIVKISQKVHVVWAPGEGPLIQGDAKPQQNSRAPREYRVARVTELWVTFTWDAARAAWLRGYGSVVVYAEQRKVDGSWSEVKALSLYLKEDAETIRAVVESCCPVEVPVVSRLPQAGVL